jgi:hypothetical protein
MKLPGGETAKADLVKLTEYCLDPSHPCGKHKARVLASVLGISVDNAELLRTALLQAAASGDAKPTASDECGDRYVIDSVVVGPRGAATVRSTWIVQIGERTPRLITCYVM